MGEALAGPVAVVVPTYNERENLPALAEGVLGLGPEYRLEASWREEHSTPWGATQAFTWCVFRAVAPA